MRAMPEIAGVRLLPLERTSDGWTVFDAAADTGVVPVQWNVVRSRPHVMRGVHVHVRHDDYLILLRGHASIGLRDLREGSPTCGAVGVVELRGDAPAALTIPPGVAHGFYFHDEAMHVYSVSEYWDMSDELGCLWSDPALGIPWALGDVVVSPRDATARPLEQLLDQLRPYQPFCRSTARTGAR